MQSRYFYPRPPRGGRLCHVVPDTVVVIFLSTPSARRATCIDARIAFCVQISIHALREEGDRASGVHYNRQKDFYPRPPRGGRHHIPGLDVLTNYISIHALREEGDFFGWCDILVMHKFLSTPSARRATTWMQSTDPTKKISIHALREEGDQHANHTRYAISDFYPRPPQGGRLCPAGFRRCKRLYFYPRPPRGGRLYVVCFLVYSVKFLSTPSARRATLRIDTFP